MLYKPFPESQYHELTALSQKTKSTRWQIQPKFPSNWPKSSSWLLLQIQPKFPSNCYYRYNPNVPQTGPNKPVDYYRYNPNFPQTGPVLQPVDDYSAMKFSNITGPALCSMKTKSNQRHVHLHHFTGHWACSMIAANPRELKNRSRGRRSRGAA